MIVTFMCQIDRSLGTQIQYYIWLCLWVCFWVRWVPEFVNSAKYTCPPRCRWASSNQLRTWIKQKEKKGVHLFLLSDGLLDLRHLISSPWTGIFTISSLGSWAFGLRLNYTTSFPTSPVCKSQIVGFLASIIAWYNSYS